MPAEKIQGQTYVFIWGCPKSKIVLSKCYFLLSLSRLRSSIVDSKAVCMIDICSEPLLSFVILTK